MDDRIAAALRAAANQVDERDLRPDVPPSHATMQPRRRPVRWIAPVIAAAAVAGIAISVTAVVDHHPNANRPAPLGVSASTSPAPRPTATPSVSVSPSGTIEHVCYFADAYACKVPSGFIWYVPLWPFAGYPQAQQWETQQGGSQPWHLDPSQTALNFTQGYLGFKDITMVTSRSIDADQAHIGVGYLGPDGKATTAAVLHLVRYEAYPGTSTAPWEVVGSDDTTFSLERPAYDSSTGPTFTAGGHITGADENIHVWVRALNVQSALVDDCCLPAGGDKQPWTRKVVIQTAGPFARVPITIIASTGGHVQEHERFAVQGINLVIPSS
jgi:hypothetical protein